MKNIYLLPTLLILSCHHEDDTILTHHLQKLLDAKEYFKLNDQYKLAKEELSAKNRLYFASYLENAFNQNEAAVTTIDSTLQEPFPDSVKSNLLLLQSDSYFKLGQYAKAAHDDSLAIEKKTLDSTTVSDVKNDLLIRNALKNTPPQQTVIADTTSIHWQRNLLGLIEIPMTTDKQTVNVIFDTRANISSITKTYADKLHLHLSDVSYTEGAGITGIKFKVSLGWVDSLYIGGVLVKNAVFQVMPDSILYLAPIKFQLNVILGFPVIAQLHEVQFHKDGRLTIPQMTTPDASRNLADIPGHNLALDGLDPVLALISDNDTLSFHFDTGASTTTLYSGYFQKYQKAIQRSAFKKEETFGGAGGVQKKPVYVLPSLHLTLGQKTVTIDSVSILTDKITPSESFYGNLGEDFMKQFDEITFNFTDMYVRGKP